MYRNASYHRGSFCRCWVVKDLKSHINDWWDEVIEFIEEPSWDEWSDICVGYGRIHTCLIVNVLQLFGISSTLVYLRFPGDWLYLKKIGSRYSQYHCIRSHRHLINGCCPSINCQ